MVTYESDCYDCGKPCLGNACPHYRVARLECDSCREEVDKLYYGMSGKQLCSKCVLDDLEEVEV